MIRHKIEVMKPEEPQVALKPSEPPRRKRASKPKVKSGCNTCKTRRIKCDEEKPTCSHCLRSRRPCSYPSKTPLGFIQYRALASTASSKEPSVILSITSFPNSSLFVSENESQYFNHFRKSTATTLSGYFSARLLDQVVLQSCESNPGIRACVIAIGALDHALDTAHKAQSADENKTQRHDGKLPYPASMHHEFALRQYGRAIKQMRESMMKEHRDVRAALIACVLTACFEALHGDMQSAIQQVRNGLTILRGYLPHGVDVTSRLESRDETHEIIQFFDRMENDCLFLEDIEPSAVMAIKPTNPRSSIDKMPVVFGSIEEAKTYFDFYLRNYFHWLAYRIGLSYREKETGTTGVSSQEQLALDSYKCVYLEAFTKWEESFKPLILSCSKSANDQRAILALSTRLRSLDASLSADPSRRELTLTLQTQEVVDLKEKTADVAPSGRTAGFTSNSIISNAYGGSQKCRNQCLGKQAIDIMESRPRGNSVDDSPVMAKIARIQMDFEASGLVSGVIPEEVRMMGIKMSCDTTVRKGQMSYLTKNRTGAFSNHHLEITW